MNSFSNNNRRFFVPSIISLLMLLFCLSSDSIIFDSSQIITHYQSNQSYPYLAAKYGDKHASYQLYESSKQFSWLELSAKQNNAKSAFLWSQIGANKSNENIWLQRSIQLGYAPAFLFKIKRLVKNKQWQVAQQLLTGEIALVDKLPKEQQAEVTRLQRLIELALKYRPSTVFQTEHFTEFSQWLLEQTIDYQSLLSLDDQSFNLSNDNIQNVNEQCKLTIQPLLEHKNYQQRVEQYQTAFKQSLLQHLPICFNKPKYLQELVSICQQDKTQRASCDLSGLLQLPWLLQSIDSFSHLLIVTESGEANVRGGVMFVEKDDTPQVFIHELAHWLGLVDEYALSVSLQKTFCQTTAIKKLGHNVYVAASHIPQEKVEQVIGRRLYKTNTCRSSMVASAPSPKLTTLYQNQSQAYKLFAEPSFMEFLDQPLSHSYAELISSHIDWNNLTPAMLNFAKILLDAGVHKGYEYFLYQSAHKQSSQALYELAERLLEQEAFNQHNDIGYQLLVRAAELNNPHAQITLGHIFIEGKHVAKNLKNSAFWYRKAAQQDEPFGLYFYGKCYEMGWGCQKSLYKAKQYYKRAAEFGNQFAQSRLQELAPFKN